MTCVLFSLNRMMIVVPLVTEEQPQYPWIFLIASTHLDMYEEKHVVTPFRYSK